VHETCVILPCAGGGSRLGLPFPKELAPLGDGRLLIDSCLSLIRAAGHHARVLLLHDGSRDQTEAYLRTRLPGVPLALARQDQDASDMPGAVLALEPWLGESNVLLLPDVIYEFTGDPVTEVSRQAREHGFCFGAAPFPREALAQLGALATSGFHVTAYQDKPGQPEHYDSAWGMLGFSGQRGLDGLKLIAMSTAGTMAGPLRLPPLEGAPVVQLRGFRDCGTWASYRAEFTERTAS
jgi:hypothetical protein